MSKNPYITEDLEFLAETAEKFAQKYIAPGFLARDQSRNFDRDLVKKMGEMGFIAPELPEQYGGQGMGRLAAGVCRFGPQFRVRFGFGVPCFRGARKNRRK